jgi:hypothetical protein
MKKITLRGYSDPGHGWIKVRGKVLFDLGIADKISPFSYMRNGSAFLEEDADASLLIEKLKSMGVVITMRCTTSNNRSKIRNYKSFNKDTIFQF